LEEPVSLCPRIGLIVPSSNTVMEPDFHRRFLGTAVVSTTRMFLEQVTREAEIRMLADDLPRAAKLIRTMAPETVIFGCTSAGSLDGLAHDARIRRTIEEATGARTVTVLDAALVELKRLNPHRVAVFTPYVEDLTTRVAQCFAEGGYRVVQTAGMGIRENLDIGRVTPAEILGFVESHLTADVDCLFLSCTNWRAVEAIELLGRRLGIPIVSSNQAAMAAIPCPAGARA
jgi:maleate isomerase